MSSFENLCFKELCDALDKMSNGADLMLALHKQLNHDPSSNLLDSIRMAYCSPNGKPLVHLRDDEYATLRVALQNLYSKQRAYLVERTRSNLEVEKLLDAVKEQIERNITNNPKE